MDDPYTDYFDDEFAGGGAKWREERDQELLHERTQAAYQEADARREALAEKPKRTHPSTELAVQDAPVAPVRVTDERQARLLELRAFLFQLETQTAQFYLDRLDAFTRQHIQRVQDMMKLLEPKLSNPAVHPLERLEAEQIFDLWRRKCKEILDRL